MKRKISMKREVKRKKTAMKGERRANWKKWNDSV